jgi:hypothetical protein
MSPGVICANAMKMKIKYLQEMNSEIWQFSDKICWNNYRFFKQLHSHLFIFILLHNIQFFFFIFVWIGLKVSVKLKVKMNCPKSI